MFWRLGKRGSFTLYLLIVVPRLAHATTSHLVDSGRNLCQVFVGTSHGELDAVTHTHPGASAGAHSGNAKEPQERHCSPRQNGALHGTRLRHLRRNQLITLNDILGVDITESFSHDICI